MAAADLLRSASWHCEKLFRKRSVFASVLWLTEDAAGTRTLFETGCDRAPDTVSDKEALAGLAADMRADFAESGVVRFVVCYLVDRVSKIDPLLRRPGVVIERHDPNERVR